MKCNERGMKWAKNNLIKLIQLYDATRAKPRTSYSSHQPYFQFDQTSNLTLQIYYNLL
jgi:hypothetical protein